MDDIATWKAGMRRVFEELLAGAACAGPDDMRYLEKAMIILSTQMLALAEMTATAAREKAERADAPPPR